MKPERIQGRSIVVEKARAFASGLAAVLDGIEAAVHAVRELFGLSPGSGNEAEK